MNKRKCDVATCTAVVPSDRFLCIDHWRLVPPYLRRTINVRYHSADNVRALLTDSVYLTACAQVIESFQNTENTASGPTNSYRRLLALLKGKQNVQT